MVHTIEGLVKEELGDRYSLDAQVIVKIKQNTGKEVPASYLVQEQKRFNEFMQYNCGDCNRNFCVSTCETFNKYKVTKYSERNNNVSKSSSKAQPTTD